MVCSLEAWSYCKKARPRGRARLDALKGRSLFRLAAQLGLRHRRPGDDVVVSDDVNLTHPFVGDVADHGELRVVDLPVIVFVGAGAELDHRMDKLAEGDERLDGSRR